jgi:hypothetical protein
MDPNIAQPIQPTATNTQALPEPEKKKLLKLNWIIIGIVLGTLALISLGVTYYFLNNNSVSNKLVQPSPTPVMTTSISPTLPPNSIYTSNTSSWKTYVDSKFGYSIKYPTDYIFQDFTKNSNMLQDLCLVYKNSEGGCVIRLDLTQEKIDDHIQKLNGGKDYRIVAREYDYYGQKAKWIEYRTLNNNAVIQGNTTIFVDFLLQKNQYLFDLHTNGWGSPYDDIFNLMLFTLKFTR